MSEIAKPEYKYSTEEFRREFKADPVVAANRKAAAEGWRNFRRNDIAIARLYWRACRRAEKRTVESIGAAIFSNASSGGLADLLK